MEPQLVVRSVVEDPDLTKWEIVDDLSVEEVRAFVFARALGASVGPDGRAIYHLLQDPSTWDARWRDDIAVVVMVNSVAREVHAIVRHGPTFRLVRLRQQATP